jgi:ppGpp synthetase/RelA/SpoT-type nucleotidyltranferase
LAAKDKIEEAVEWYRADSPLYEELALLVESVVKEMLKQKKVNYHNITHRAKTVERYKEKASKEKYKDPRSEIMDMAGVRVITYIDSDAKKVEEIVRSLFKIIPEHSKDKTEELGTDRVGYRSIHCVCTLGEDRLALPENKKFTDRCFEVQIRTILQHAWAEFEHDRNYKFKGVLPDKLKRRLAVVAGNLELLDWTFESIAGSIDEYTIEVHKKTAKGDLSTRITSASLKVYLGKKFEGLVDKGLFPDLVDDARIIGELSTVGIVTLEQLDKAIPGDFVEVSVEQNCIETYLGTLRDVMVIFDADTYFEQAWQKSWNVLSPESVNLLKHYGIEIDNYIKKYDLEIQEYLPDYEMPDYEPPEYEPDYEPPEEEPPDYEPPEEEPPEEELSEEEPSEDPAPEEKPEG